MADTVTVDADDARALSGMFAAAVQSFGPALASYPGFEKAVQACARLAIAAESAQMPEDPVSDVKSSAIVYHETLTEFMEAGFYREEAFELVRINAQACAQLGLMRSIHG